MIGFQMIPKEARSERRKKTRTWLVMKKRNIIEPHSGLIRWDSEYRKYIFTPLKDVNLDASNLEVIQIFLQKKNKELKKLRLVNR